VLNLLSEGIVNADGTPGPNYKNATQYQALDTTVYQLSPPKTGPYKTLPRHWPAVDILRPSKGRPLKGSRHS
jgi:hypothetical protein